MQQIKGTFNDIISATLKLSLYDLTTGVVSSQITIF